MSLVQDENYGQLDNVFPPSVVSDGEDFEAKYAFNIYNLKWNFSHLLGEVLTIVDATGMEEKQLKAVKDLVRNKFVLALSRLRDEARSGLTSGRAANILPTHPDYGKGRKAKGNSIS